VKTDEFGTIKPDTYPKRSIKEIQKMAQNSIDDQDFVNEAEKIGLFTDVVPWTKEWYGVDHFKGKLLFCLLTIII